MTSAAINTNAAVEVAKSAADLLPGEGKTLVLAHLISAMTVNELRALSREARAKLLEAHTGAEAAPSATTSAAGGRIEIVDGHKAVVGKITVNGQQLDTLLSEGSFNKLRSDQIQYAEKLGYRMATRGEHRAYVEGLLAKEDNNTINDSEKNALQTYRERYVRDDQGGLDVVGRRVRGSGSFSWLGGGCPSFGALFVRASAE